MPHRHFLLPKPYGCLSQFASQTRGEAKKRLLGEFYDFLAGAMVIVQLEENSGGSGLSNLRNSTFVPAFGWQSEIFSCCCMARRNSPNDIQELTDLNQLSEIVVDKRLGKRDEAKKSRRNRHYEKQFIKNALTGLLDNDEG